MSTAIPRNVFGRPEDEITSDFQMPENEDQVHLLQSSARLEHATQPLPVWRPLTDDEIGASSEAEPLLDSLRRTRVENPPGSPDGERGGGQPGLN
jgi:hypothetical protein